MKLFRLALTCSALVAALTVAAPATAGTTLKYHATFVRAGPDRPSAHRERSAGAPPSAGLAHGALQSIAFGACGANCHVRTITFDDGSTLLMRESVVGVISPGSSSSAGDNAPDFLEISQTIVGGTGRFAGATGSGSGRVNRAAEAIVTASGTIKLP